jgi:hypothetical protein
VKCTPATAAGTLRSWTRSPIGLHKCLVVLLPYGLRMIHFLRAVKTFHHNASPGKKQVHTYKNVFITLAIVLKMALILDKQTSLLIASDTHPRSYTWW